MLRTTELPKHTALKRIVALFEARTVLSRGGVDGQCVARSGISFKGVAMAVPIALRDGVRTPGRFGIPSLTGCVVCWRRTSDYLASPLGTGNGGSVGWTFWLPTVR
jgi:hypothetical protein